MKNWTRIIQGSAIAAFLVFSSGCIIAPDHDHDHGEEHHDRHCDEHDDHCH
jgi:hypothetical protein